MKFIISTFIVLVFGLTNLNVQAATLAERYTQSTPEILRQYDALALTLKPKLEPLERKVLALSSTQQLSTHQKLERLQTVQQKLEHWVGQDLLRYVVLLPLLNTINGQRQILARSLPITIPYKDHQIKTQFNITGAQPYALGAGNLTLIRGQLQRGDLHTGDKVILYFKQSGPVTTSIREDVSARDTRSFLLNDDIPADRFLGNAVLLIPQS